MKIMFNPEEEDCNNIDISPLQHPLPARLKDKEVRIVEAISIISDIRLYKTDSKFDFLSNQRLFIFAMDKNDNLFVGINNIVAIDADEIPIGYIGINKTYGKIASNLKEFLALILFYPFWQEILEYELKSENYSVKSLELNWVKDKHDFYQLQKTVSQELSVAQDDLSITKLLSNLKQSSHFKVCTPDGSAFEQLVKREVK